MARALAVALAAALSALAVASPGGLRGGVEVPDQRMGDAEEMGSANVSLAGQVEFVAKGCAGANGQRVERLAPGCLGQCQYMGICGVLEALVGVPGADRQEVVCNAEAAISCLLQGGHRAKCQPAIAAGGLGLPRSLGELQSRCALLAAAPSGAPQLPQPQQQPAESNATLPADASNGTTLPDAAAAVQLAAAGCGGAYAQQLDRLSPGCLAQCQAQGVCAAFDNAVAAWLPGKSAAAAKGVVCAHKASFACLLQDGHKGRCQAAIAAGSSFGVPGSLAELNSRCR